MQAALLANRHACGTPLTTSLWRSLPDRVGPESNFMTGLKV